MALSLTILNPAPEFPLSGTSVKECSFLQKSVNVKDDRLVTPELPLSGETIAGNSFLQKTANAEEEGHVIPSWSCIQRDLLKKRGSVFSRGTLIIVSRTICFFLFLLTSLMYIVSFSEV